MRNIIKKLRKLFRPSRGSVLVERIYGDFIARIRDLEKADELFDVEVNEKLAIAQKYVAEAKELQSTRYIGIRLCSGLKQVVAGVVNDAEESTAD